MKITAETLLKQFDAIGNVKAKRKVYDDLSRGLDWLDNKGTIRVVINQIDELPQDSVTCLNPEYFPAIAITKSSMDLIERDNGVRTGWDGDPNLLPPKLLVARTVKLIGEIPSTDNRNKVTMFVPSEKKNCLIAIGLMMGRFARRVTFE